MKLQILEKVCVVWNGNVPMCQCMQVWTFAPQELAISWVRIVSELCCSYTGMLGFA